MKIKRLEWKEIQPYYANLYRRAFGPEKPNEEEIPAIVYVGYDANQELKGFVAGYLHNANTFYLQRVGMVKEIQGQRASGELFCEAAKRLVEDGIQYLTATISNTDIRALRAALGSGFLINGVKIDMAGRAWVMVIKELAKEGESSKVKGESSKVKDQEENNNG